MQLASSLDDQIGVVSSSKIVTSTRVSTLVSFCVVHPSLGRRCLERASRILTWSAPLVARASLSSRRTSDIFWLLILWATACCRLQFWYVQMVSECLIHFWAQVFGRSRGCSLYSIGECIVLWDSTFVSRIHRIFPCSSVSGRWVSAQLWTCRPIWLTKARTHVTGYSS